MAVLDDQVVIENLPEGERFACQAVNNPEDPAAGERSVPHPGTLHPARGLQARGGSQKFFRLKPDGKVRLRYGCVIHSRKGGQDAEGNVVELCVVPTIRTPLPARTPRKAARSRASSTGFPPPMR
ncbi:MAG: hypothetical protein R3F17_16295 [Planctomycetota bacterium]